VEASERLDRIEHVVAGMVEERRKDREEYRQLWRDTQKNIQDLTLKIAETNHAIAETNHAIVDADERLSAQIQNLAKESREADRRLAERIDSLVSAMGEFIRQGKEAR
jgi:septal ring factor EnvC (AmiA/AmiB activator)